MSYCVNCGVELDVTATACPLCQTKIYHPNQPVATDVPTPYATVKGVSEPVKNNDFVLLMSIILLTTTVVCVFLNFVTLPYGRWSFYVAGICAMLWVFLIPAFFPDKVNIFLSVAFDGIIIALNMLIVHLLHPGNGWYFHIALPLTAVIVICLEIYCFYAVHKKCSMLTKAFIIVTAIAVICGTIEAVIDFHLNGYVFLRWSSIALTCGLVIDIVLATIYLRKGLRNEVRRRMHF